MRENRRMLHLLRELDLHEQERREDGVTQFEISLRAEQRSSSVYDKVLPTFQRVKEIAKMASFAFVLPVLPGQEENIRHLSEAIGGSGPLREEYEASCRRLGINEEKVWVQRTPIGQAVVVYWETEDPQRALRAMADSQDEVDNMLKQFIETTAPAIDLTKKHPLSNELILEWSAR
jgi:hypothetical protein